MFIKTKSHETEILFRGPYTEKDIYTTIVDQDTILPEIISLAKAQRYDFWQKKANLSNEKLFNGGECSLKKFWIPDGKTDKL